MSGHSKWHSIKHKKGANDAKRGKIFTKHARLITISAKNGADPEKNPTLRAAIDYAKADNVPNENIERAIKKGSGDNADEAQLQEITYEGYGPNGVALMIQVVTDNRNRSVANVRTIMTKNGGNLGESGSVGYMFERKSYFLVNPENQNTEDLELQLIELGAEDFEETEDGLAVYVAPDKFFEFKTLLEAEKLKVIESKLSLFPTNIVKIEDLEIARKTLNLIDKLEEDDDVMEVIGNFDISESLLEQI